MERRYWTGIGGRIITSELESRMHTIGADLALLGYILRSGAADGSDAAFEFGCDCVDGKKEIYLPHKKFNGHPSEFYVKKWKLRKEAEEIAAKHHPNWEACLRPENYFSRCAHIRNVAQVLGWDLNTPSDFVVCYTWNGTKVGGTATAMSIAESMNIPVCNLFHPDAEDVLNFLLKVL